MRNFKMQNSFSHRNLARFKTICQNLLVNLKHSKKMKAKENQDRGVRSVEAFYSSMKEKFGLHFGEEHPNYRYLMEAATALDKEEKITPPLKNLVVLWCPKVKIRNGRTSRVPQQNA